MLIVQFKTKFTDKNFILPLFLQTTINTISSANKQFPLTLALLEKDVEIAELLIERGASVNVLNSDGSSLLMSAISNGDNFTAEFLLNHSCDVNQTNEQNECALHQICKISDRELRKDLLGVAKRILSTSNVIVDIQNNQGFSPLHHAIVSGFSHMIDELLKVDKIDLNQQTKKGQCHLELALLQNDYTIATKLIESGADPNIRLNNGDHLIHHLIKSELQDAAIFLCKHIEIDSINLDDETSLHIAAKKNYAKLVEELLKNGASPNLQCEQDRGKSALHYAIEYDSKNVIEIFVRKNDESCKIDFNLSTTDNVTPLNMALELQRHELVPQLIEGGSNVNAKNSNGLTLLHLAILNKSSETAVFLIKNGAYIEELTPENESPLLLAIQEECPEVVEILCSNGASLSSTGYGKSPLLVALKNKQENIANVLVSHGIDLDCWSPAADGTLQTLLHHSLMDDIRDEFAAAFLIKKGCDIDSPKQADPNESSEISLTRESPLHMCCRLGLLQTVQNLVKNGANLNPLNNENLTPLHVAIKNKQEEIIKVLLEQPSIDLKIRDKNGNTPFALTLAVRNHKVAQRILEKMPNAAEQMDARGRNFLHLAILNEDLETILFLISIQVDVNSRVHDVNQLTPLMLAASSENEMIIRNLILAGARLNERDSSQRTALVNSLLNSIKILNLISILITAYCM
jgi:rabankyrin-5